MGWFSKKLAIELTDDDGKSKKVKIAKRQLDQWVAEGAVTLHDGCTAYILDPKGNRTEKWIIGEHVSQDTYDRLKDADGSLYVMVYYEGEPKTTVLKREIWEHAKGVLDSKPAYHQASVPPRLENVVSRPQRRFGFGWGAIGLLALLVIISLAPIGIARWAFASATIVVLTFMIEKYRRWNKGSSGNRVGDFEGS